jgi:hypothetical protein
MKFTMPIITAAAAVGISVAMAATASAYSRGPMRGRRRYHRDPVPRAGSASRRPAWSARAWPSVRPGWRR